MTRDYHGSILIVDDDAPLRRTLVAMLEEAGYLVMEAADGREALETVAGAAVDLVISDVMMPDRDGIEVIIELKRRLPALPVIAMSGGGRARNLDFLDVAARMGAVATLEKPFRRAALLAAVEGALSQQ